MACKDGGGGQALPFNHTYGFQLFVFIWSWPLLWIHGGVIVQTGQFGPPCCTAMGKLFGASEACAPLHTLVLAEDHMALWHHYWDPCFYMQVLLMQESCLSFNQVLTTNLEQWTTWCWWTQGTTLASHTIFIVYFTWGSCCSSSWKNTKQREST